MRSPELAERILHFGLGAFHRAHQAAFTQDAGGRWRIEAVSMRNPALSDALNAAGGVYHLVERHPEGPLLIRMTVIDRAHCLAADPGAVVARIADPDVRIVTATVTEKGYGFDPATRRLDPSHPSVAPDLARPEAPRGLVGAIVEGLRLRRAAGHAGLSVMSCDNLTGNGHLLAGLVDDFARRRAPGLADWIAETCSFPDSMVDRITPASSEATFAAVREATGQDDPLAVETEPFRQWVIEDVFAGPRPAWEAAGALIVTEVAPFETMKLRLLNGAHSMTAYLGALAGLPAVRDVMAEADLRALVRAHMSAAAATLAPLPGYDAEAYADTLIERFSNPAIDHRVLQIAMDGSQKLPQRIFAPARDRLGRGAGVETFALATAAWIRFAEGRDEAGAALGLNDPLAGPIRAALARAGTNPEDRVAALSRVEGLAHLGLLSDPRFGGSVARHLDWLTGKGVRATVAEVLRGLAEG